MIKEKHMKLATFKPHRGWYITARVFVEEKEQAIYHDQWRIQTLS